MPSDNFNRADGGIGANWTVQDSETPQIVSNQIDGANFTADAVAFWNVDSFGANQYSKIKNQQVETC